MSRSLSIECDWLDQPCAANPVERRTWAGIRIRVAGRVASRLWDRAAESERQTLYLPAFPLAEWLIASWWPLQNEANVADSVPPAGPNPLPAHREWLSRHCFRSADAGLLLPRLCLFNSGRGLCAHWAADDPDAYVHMPGSFVGADSINLDATEAESGLREFVAEVLSRVGDMADSRIVRARANWEAISRAGTDERAFCKAAGRMGLDPYASEDWPEGLVELLETGIGDDPDNPLTRDFLEAASCNTAQAEWQWTTEAANGLALRAAPRTVLAELPTPEQTRPATAGYSAARTVRAKVGIRHGEPLQNVSNVSQLLDFDPLALQEVNHVPSRRLQAVVGWQRGRTPTVAGPIPSREANRRFLEARALYYALYACDRGARLATDARTWDQQASRAFAAELLAPQSELLAAVDAGSKKFDVLVGELANRYRVSTRVVEHQLENAGLSSLD